MQYATQQAATDPTTGLIDMDVIMTGKTSSSRQRVNRIKEIVFAIIKYNVTRFSKNSTVDNLHVDVDKKWDGGERVQERELV